MSHDDDERFRRLFSWALVVIVGVSLLRFATSMLDETVMDRIERVSQFWEQRKHERLLEDVRKADEVYR